MRARLVVGLLAGLVAPSLVAGCAGRSARVAPSPSSTRGSLALVRGLAGAAAGAGTARVSFRVESYVQGRRTGAIDGSGVVDVRAETEALTGTWHPAPGLEGPRYPTSRTFVDGATLYVEVPAARRSATLERWASGRLDLVPFNVIHITPLAPFLRFFDVASSAEPVEAQTLHGERVQGYLVTIPVGAALDTVPARFAGRRRLLGQVGDPVRAEVWLDSHGRPVRIVTHQTFTEGKTGEATVDLWDWGRVPAPVPPVAAETTAFDTADAVFAATGT